LPGDSIETMQKTLNLSMELCTIAWNAYAVMALPGSKLYKDALDKDYKLPKDYSVFSFHSYDTLPLPTKFLNPPQILEFRDKAFSTYHSNPKFLDRIRYKYGMDAVNNIKEMTKIKLKREILGD
jgi:hypothetical protein